MSESNANQRGDLAFWDEKWRTNNIGFHRTVVNESFKKHLLSKITSSDRRQCVFFPLCGKTVDMKAVLDEKHQVIGIECSQLGIEAFFNENNIQYDMQNDTTNECQVYKGIDLPITIFSANFFTFNHPLPTIDWIWDRGGLVAINVADREQYRDALLRTMTPGHTQLFILALYYDDPEFSGPPRNLSDNHIAELFGSTCSIELVEVGDVTEEFNLNNKRNLKRMEERLHLIVRK